jgi:hypothetical protein
MTPASGPPADIGDAFRSLLGRLEAMADTVDRASADPVERAEGYRHLTRLFSACQEWFVEKSDAERPAFTRVMTPWRKFIGDNPDTIYDVAPVSATTSYRLRGEINDASYLGLTVYGRDADGAITLLARIADDEFVADDGTFDLAVGGDDPGDGPWLAVPDGAESLWVRQYFSDLAEERAATYELRSVDPPGPSDPVGEERVAAAFARIEGFMADTLDAVTTVSRMMAGSPNAPLMAGAEFAVGENDDDGSNELESILLKLARTSYPTPDNRYAGVWFDLGPDETLVVTGTPPPNARYWGVQLANRWQESLDYREHRVCLNDHQIELETDGSYRIVVSATDPGTGNWLDTAGHRNGMVNVRALLADGLDDPSFEVVPAGVA